MPEHRRARIGVRDRDTSVADDALASASDRPGQCLTRLCLEIVAMASRANALAAGAPVAIDERGLTRRAPRTERLERLLDAPGAADLSLGLRVKLRALVEVVKGANGSAGAVACRPAASPDRNASPEATHTASLAAAWRQVANVAYVAHWLAARTATPICPVRQSDVERLGKLLQTVARGGWLAFDGSGTLGHPKGPSHQAFTLASTPRSPDGFTISTTISNRKA